MKPANFAPVYACLYPQLTEIARKHGYALATHGSMARDFDLVCIPWIAEPANPQVVVDEITATFAIREEGKPETREHGRLVYTLAVKFGECFIDLSFTPSTPAAERPDHRAVMQRALEALQTSRQRIQYMINNGEWYSPEEVVAKNDEAIAALKEALK